MNPNAGLNKATDSLEYVAPGTLERGVISRASFVETWLHDHLQGVALAVIAASFVVRIVVASRSYLNPDEALHYLLINQPSAFLAYKASLTNAHPPLIYLLLYFWHFLGRSELMLRLPSVFAGTALCWVMFKWIGILFGRAASLIGLMIVAFTPAMIALSVEVREYALLLFCMVTALYFLGRAFQEKSVRKMWCFSAFLYLAILSHYSAVFFALALGVYSLARIADSQLPRKVVTAWVIGQVGALAIYLFLYVTHVSKIKESIALWAAPFDQVYFHSDRGDIFTFTRENTSNIFFYLFSERDISQTLLLFFVVAVAFLFVRDLISHRGNPRSSRLGILLLLPFIAVWGAAIAGVYPYVGSRHTVFLAPFAIAAVSFLLAAASGQKLWAGLLIATLLIGASNTSGKPLEPGFTKENQDRALMIAAVHHIQQAIPRGDLILVDYQSSLPLAYYLCGSRQVVSIDRSHAEFDKFSCNGYPIVSLHLWKLRAEALPLQFPKLARTYGLKPGDRFWVFQAGWGGSLVEDLPWFFPQFRCLAPKNFGEDISVIPFVVGPDLLPATPLKNCSGVILKYYRPI